LDFSLVSTKNLSKILPSSVWGPWPDNFGQKGLNLRHLRHHPQKNEIQNLKTSFSLQTRRLAKSYERMNSSLVKSTAELWSCQDLANLKRISASSKGLASEENPKESGPSLAYMNKKKIGNIENRYLVFAELTTT